MYEYELTSGKLTIHTPGNHSFSDIKKERTQTADCMIEKSTYPNGLYIETHQYANRIVIISSHELIENEDGSFTSPV